MLEAARCQKQMFQMTKDNQDLPITDYKCPACGKQVFNRRYARCEFCGAVLPSGIAYSEEDRHKLLEADRTASDKAWRERQREEEENERAERARGG